MHRRSTIALLAPNMSAPAVSDSLPISRHIINETRMHDFQWKCQAIISSTKGQKEDQGAT